MEIDVASRVTLDHDRGIGVARLVLARGSRNNAIDMAFVESLDECCQRVKVLVEAGEVTCVVITAQGQHFSVGGDLQDFPQGTSVTTAHIQKMARLAHRATDTLHGLPVPVIAGVHGAVAGAGIGLTLCADLVVAAQSTRFILAYSAVGLSPDGGTSWALPRVVGMRRAMDLMLTNRSLSADEAEGWGLVSRVVPDENLATCVEDFVMSLVRLPAEVLVSNKRLLRSSTDNCLTAHLADEAQTIAHLSAQPFAQKLMAEFLAHSSSS